MAKYFTNKKLQGYASNIDLPKIHQERVAVKLQDGLRHPCSEHCNQKSLRY